MSAIYIFIKIYPFIALSFAIVFFDLMRALKRKGNKTYLLMASFMTFCLGTAGIWILARGDKNAEVWFRALQDFFMGR